MALGLFEIAEAERIVPALRGSETLVPHGYRETTALAGEDPFQAALLEFELVDHECALEPGRQEFLEISSRESRNSPMPTLELFPRSVKLEAFGRSRRG